MHISQRQYGVRHLLSRRSQSVWYDVSVLMIKSIIAILLIFFISSAQAEPARIVAFGDSLIHGFGLAQKDGFVPNLERWLLKQGAEVDLINAGVSGDTTAGGAARVDWSVTPDVDGMIIILGANDALRGIDPSDSERNLDKILGVVTERDIEVLLIGIPAPQNFGANYKRQFDAIFPNLAQKYPIFYFENFFAGLNEISTDPAKLLEYFQDDGIHPNLSGVTIIVEVIGPIVLQLIERIHQN